MGGKHLVIAAVLLGMAAVLPAAVSAQVPADAKALLDQAQTALSAKQWQQAADALSALVILDPRWFNFQNLGAAEFNLGRYERAIKVDPTKADAYFIKGSALYGNGTLDQRNKYVVPPGTVEALQKYLQLAPNGGHVEDVRAMLGDLKSPVKPK